jgi:hypothetical protein
MNRPMRPRRTQETVGTEKFFEQSVYASVEWPGRTVRLQPDSLLDFRNRSSSPNVSSGESYHEASKLYPEMLLGLAAMSIDAQKVRELFVRRRGAAWSELETFAVFCPKRAFELVSSLTDSAPLGLFYAVEIRIAVADHLWFLEPTKGALIPIKKLTGFEEIQSCLGLLEGAPAWPTSCTLFLVGSFARNVMLYGERGYRRTVLEAGQMSQLISERARMLELEFTLKFEFADRRLDRLLEVDGTEEGTLAAFEFRAEQ